MNLARKLILFMALFSAILIAASGNVHGAYIVAFTGAAAAVPWSAYSHRLCFAGVLNMLDLARSNSVGLARECIEESAGAIPEMQLFPAEQLGVGSAGQNILAYETLVRVGYPSATFRDMGGGLAASKSVTRIDKFECFPFGSRIQAAKTLADAYARGGPAGYFAFEAFGVAQVTMFTIAQQIYYGRSLGNGKGFPGLHNFTAFGSTYTDPITGKTYPVHLNAGGTTANTGSSVYGIKFSTDPVNKPDGVQLEFGGGSVFDLPEPMMIDLPNPNGDGTIVRYYAAELNGFAGLMIPNNHCVRRIGNITLDAGAGLTDSLLADFWAAWPQNIKPDVIMMSQRSQKMLQKSRTVTLFGNGTVAPNQPLIAPLPTEYMGCPIHVTDAISDTEAIEVAAAPDE